MMKTLNRSIVLTVLALSSFMAMPPAQAVETKSIPHQKQVAGFYQHQLGNVQITALLDGTNYLSPALFKGIPAAKVTQILKKYYADQAKGVQTSVNAFLVNTGSSLVLVDSGSSSCNGPNFGSVIKNLKAAGYKPEQVDTILLTHLHPDHVCGISDKGVASFPNATVYVADAEANYWLNPKQAAKLPQDKQSRFKQTVEKIQQAVQPYQATKHFKTFKLGDKIKGFDVISTAGHTPGHSSFGFKSGNEEIVFIGDIVHSHSIQFDQPETAIDFDVDPKKAVQTRLAQFARLAKNGQTVAAPHLPFPGIGHIYSADAKHYQWIPVHFKD
ncbi:MBL fold metallo-hydrolase [Acinetobacter sp. ANC 4280]|uniref:MBL fold metallo-hydrolase n=2 Tax=Acinetobacter terrae TaxID=2731247 RepID=A0A8E4MFA6_9GAMM|nr:MBL fold metallo-hydrolase [Acinetobacter terrae]NNH38451.1 MBL fold metallo-hydrolase [Acinetobacter terrae]